MKATKAALLCICITLIFNSCKKEDHYIPTVNVAALQSASASDLTKVVFPTASTGYITTADGQVLKTTDGGLTWTAKQVAPASVMLLSLTCPNDQVIFVSGKDDFDGYCYKSINGGTTWTQITGPWSFIGINFPTTTTGYSFTDGELYKSTDGGIYWNRVNQLWDAFDADKARFCSRDTGVILDFDGEMFRTTDGGTNVTPVNEFLTYNNTYKLVDVEFISSTQGYAIDYQGGVFRTMDAGASWSQIKSPSTESGADYGTSAVWANGNTVLVVGYETMLLSKDGGSSFKNYFNQQGISTGATFLDVVLLTPNKAIAVALGGKIYTITF
jgi:photosystem II stability/assembly factor-like uncharacterized protein